MGTVYSPVRLILELEDTGDRNNFIDLQKFFLEVKCETTKSAEAHLK